MTALSDHNSLNLNQPKLDRLDHKAPRNAKPFLTMTALTERN